MSFFNQVESASFSNIAATPAAFTLRGGCYGITVHATFGGGSVDLKRLAADGSTYISVLSAAFAADGYATVNVPQGTYEIVIATATGVYVDVTSVFSTFG